VSTFESTEISLQLQAEAKDILTEIARRNGFELSELCSVILSAWATHGGSLWMGRKKIVIDWPREYAFLNREEKTASRE